MRGAVRGARLLGTLHPAKLHAQAELDGALGQHGLEHGGGWAALARARLHERRAWVGQGRHRIGGFFVRHSRPHHSLPLRGPGRLGGTSRVPSKATSLEPRARSLESHRLPGEAGAASCGGSRKALHSRHARLPSMTALNPRSRTRHVSRIASSGRSSQSATPALPAEGRRPPRGRPPPADHATPAQ